MSEAMLVIYIISSLSLCFFFIVFKALWWTPRRIQKLMAAQGIKGPTYRFFHGNNKEIETMSNEAMNTPRMELTHDTFSRLQPHFYTWKKLYGANFMIWIGPKPKLVVTDHELVRVILNNRDGVYEKPRAEGHQRKLLGDGLFTVSGKKWHKQRKLANHAFNTHNLKGMAEEIVSSAEAMLGRWRSRIGLEIEVFQEFKLLTAEVISRTAFGSSFLEGQKIFAMLTKMTQIMQKNAHTINIPLIGNIFKTRDDVETDKLQQQIKECIMKMIQKREESHVVVDDFLGSLLSAHHSDDESKKISIDDMVDECKTFYIGGHETTLTWLGWTIFLLAVHIDWQDKARQEVVRVFGQENPNPKGLSTLRTMTMIVNESIRLYSPLVMIIRKASREVRLGDITVPGGMELNIPTLALHQNPEIWGKDVLVFKPERFSEGGGNKKGAYIPFGLGARTCVGTNFAFTETQTVLSMILQRYRFTLSPNYVHTLGSSGLFRPQHGLQIILHPL